MIGPGFDPHQTLLVAMWERMAQLPCWPPRGFAPELNLRDCVTCTPLPGANKAAHSGFETQRRHHQNSKTGVSVTPHKDLCPPKKVEKSWWLPLRFWIPKYTWSLRVSVSPNDSQCLVKQLLNPFDGWHPRQLSAALNVINFLQNTGWGSKPAAEVPWKSQL